MDSGWIGFSRKAAFTACPGFQSCLVLLVSLLFMLPMLLAGQQIHDSAEVYYKKAHFYAFRGIYDSALQCYQSSAELFAGKGMDDRAVESKIMMADVLNQKGAFSDALDRLQEGKQMIRLHHSDNGRLNSLADQVTGNHYLLTGRLDSADAYLHLALAERMKAVGEPDSSFAYLYSKMGYLQYLFGQYDSAYMYYDRALQLALTKKSKENYEISSFYQGKGIALSMKGAYNDAETNFLQSLKNSKLYLTESDPSLARLYINLGNFYYIISKIEEAFKYFKEAEKIYIKTYEKNNVNLASIYWNIGNYYIYKGDYEESINYLQEALYIFSYNFPENHPRLKALNMDLGVAFEKKGDYLQAINYYNQSIRNNSTPSVIKSFRNLANTYRRLGDNKDAQLSYIKSIEFSKTINSSSRDLALCYRYYGQFLLESLHDKTGLTYYELSLDILKKNLRPDHEDIARGHLLYGEYYLSEYELSRADENVDRALDLMAGTLGGLGEEGPISAELGIFLSEALDLKARVLYQQFLESRDPERLEECLRTIHSSIQYINDLRMSYTNEESKLILMGRAKSTISTGIAAAYEMYELTSDSKYAGKVFELGEQSKSIVLLNSLRGLEALKMSSIPESLIEKEKNLKSSLYSYNSLIYKEKQGKYPDDAKIRLWQSTVFDLKKRYDSLLASFEVNYPSFYQLKYNNTVVSFDSSMKSLGSDQALIEFSRTDAGIYVSVLTNSLVECYIVKDTDSSLSSYMAEFTELLRKNTMGNYSREDFNFLQEAGFLIYQRLLGPAESWIRDKRLIIVPDGELGYLSFESLVTEEPETTEPDYRSLPYLLFKHPISYSSSATILFGVDKQVKKKRVSRLLAFAPSYSSDLAGSTLRSSEPGIDSLRLLPIKGVEEEVSQIMAIFKGRSFSGQQATESNFKRLAGEFNVLHLAMHTLIDNKNPLFSKMVFTSGGDDSEDGLLNTYELFSMDLKGSLGVLSACNTGSGKLERGEGIMSLARGFIYAGIPNLVMTLWEIDDQPSSDIMTNFYGYLADGFPTDIALQQAKIDYIQTADKFMSHPSYWAGFVNIGKSKVVSQEPGFLRYWWIPAILVVLLAIFFINRQVYWHKKSD